MISVDITRIKTLAQAKRIINQLIKGLNNCPAAEFCVCKHCGSIYTKGWLCPVCSHDNSI